MKCQDGGFTADERLGIDGRFSIAVQRLVSLAAASWSFDISSKRLAELCGLQISENTIRDIAPVARVAFAAIERSERFGHRWKAWSRRLGLFDLSRITLLADEAK